MAETWKEFAFVGDVATLSDTAASDVGTTASAGTGGAGSRYDHVHELGSGVVDDSTIELSAGALQVKALGIVAAKLAAGAATTAKIDIDGNLAMGGYQATNLVLHQSSSTPTPVVGKIFQDAEDQKVYICTVAS